MPEDPRDAIALSCAYAEEESLCLSARDNLSICLDAGTILVADVVLGSRRAKETELSASRIPAAQIGRTANLIAIFSVP